MIPKPPHIAFNLVFGILFCYNSLLGQTINTQWRIVGDNEPGNRSFSMARGRDNSITIAGKAFLGLSGTTPDDCVGLQRARVARYNAKGDLLWKRCLGVGKTSNASVVISTSDNGLIVGGIADEDVSITAINPNYKMETAQVYKLDSAGNIQWKALFGGSAQDHLISATETSDKGIVLLGVTNSSDVDITGYHMPSTSQRPFDLFIVKYDQSGNKLWTRCYGGTGMEEGAYGTLSNRLDGFGHAIKETPDGGLVFVGSTASTNGDVSGNHGLYDAWIVKTNNLGQVQWQKCVGGSGDDGFQSIILTQDGGYIATGKTTSTNGDISGNHGNTDALIVKFSSTGLIEWQKCIGGSANDEAHHIIQEDDGGYACVGNSSSSNGDFQNNSGQSDAVIFKLNNNGQLVWYKNFGGSDRDDFCSILPAEPNNYLVAGFSYSKDKDLGGCNVSPASIIFKLGQVNIIKGQAFIDLDADCIHDANEPFAVGAFVQSSKNGNGNGGLTDSTGNFYITVDTGAFTTNIYLPYYLPTPDHFSSLFGTYQNVDSVTFCLRPKPGIRDLRVDLVPLSFSRGGSLNIYRLTGYNAGTETIVNDTLRFVKDIRSEYYSVSPFVDSMSSDTLIWIIPFLEPLKIFEATVTIELSRNLVIGDTITNSAFIHPVLRDTTPVDNRSIIRQKILASYDPNDKSEFSGGSLSSEQVTKGEYLNYLVRFQNTGNDTAFNVIVTDTLDNNLDWSGIQMIKASHKYSMQVANGNKVTWTFENIKLPDSNINEPKSHGFISYRIKPKASLNIGDTIKNSASIYFDFNAPVKTNTTITIIKQELTFSPLVTGLQTAYCSNLGIQKAKITNLPASVSGITTTVKIDSNNVSLAPDSTFSFNVSTLSAGAHTITVQFSNATASKITSSDFTVTAAAMPDVNISANITTIINLTTDVTVTAVNAANGGTAPLYTFSKDRNFNTVSQPESISNTWTFNPTTLLIGDNKIYVTMRSNAACVITNTVTDSILLVRSSVTGITDPDMPGQLINIFPNPFKDVITISGLSPSKTYTIRLLSLEGKLLTATRVAGRSSLLLRRQHQSKGIYWLSIYDEKRKQLLGTVKMMRN